MRDARTTRLDSSHGLYTNLRGRAGKSDMRIDRLQRPTLYLSKLPAHRATYYHLLYHLPPGPFPFKFCQMLAAVKHHHGSCNNLTLVAVLGCNARNLHTMCTATAALQLRALAFSRKRGEISSGPHALCPAAVFILEQFANCCAHSTLSPGRFLTLFTDMCTHRAY